MIDENTKVLVQIERIRDMIKNLETYIPHIKDSLAHVETILNQRMEHEVDYRFLLLEKQLKALKIQTTVKMVGGPSIRIVGRP